MRNIKVGWEPAGGSNEIRRNRVPGRFRHQAMPDARSEHRRGPALPHDLNDPVRLWRRWTEFERIRNTPAPAGKFPIGLTSPRAEIRRNDADFVTRIRKRIRLLHEPGIRRQMSRAEQADTRSVTPGVQIAFFSSSAERELEIISR